MRVLILSRAVPELPEATDAEEAALDEQHWTYMDVFADRFIARGPLVGPGRDSWHGSLHVVDLAGPKSIRSFVQEEPFERRGLFASHEIFHFTDVLGRTMWEFDRAAGDPTFLVVMRGEDAFAVPGRWRDRLVLHGSLRGYQDDEPAGTALIVQTRSREEIDELTAAGSGEVEVLDWAFGGRR